MPKTIETPVYKYAELSDEAKEKAREWYSQFVDDYEWWDFIYGDCVDIAASFGLTIKKIWFTGFWSQGDGACFDGSYDYQKGWKEEFHKILTPGDTSYDELFAIAKGLQDLQRKRFYKMSCTVKHSGHYYHEQCISVNYYLDGEDLWYYDTDDSDFEQMKEYLQDYMRWIYRRLEEEYEYMTSDEQLAEGIEANEYTFTEEGERFG